LETGTAAAYDGYAQNTIRPPLLREERRHFAPGIFGELNEAFVADTEPRRSGGSLNWFCNHDRTQNNVNGQ
jgi:hypothetical protein